MTVLVLILTWQYLSHLTEVLPLPAGAWRQNDDVTSRLNDVNLASLRRHMPAEYTERCIIHLRKETIVLLSSCHRPLSHRHVFRLGFKQQAGMYSLFLPALMQTSVICLHWLVGCFWFNGPLRQYFSLHRAVFQREGERGEKR